LLTASDDRHDADTQPAETGEVWGADDYYVDIPDPRRRDGLRHRRGGAGFGGTALQTKFPKQLGKREPIVRRTDLGAKGIYYRATVVPFAPDRNTRERH
jgi:hypothetical protein